MGRGRSATDPGCWTSSSTSRRRHWLPWAPMRPDLSTRRGSRCPAASGCGRRSAGGGTAPYSPRSADEEALLRACAALELLHASALVHDDLMDASDTRRGRPATHRAFEAQHLQARWSGSPTQYGAAAAILQGDLLLRGRTSCWAVRPPAGAGRPRDGCLRACRNEVIAGQFLDVSVQARAEADVDTAMTVLRYKSAKYSIERPLHIGAALAGGNAEMQEALTRFGLPLGEAFQLRDDLLGVFGDPSATGKPAGDDLVEGKRTVLVALTLDAASPEDRATARRGARHPLDEARVEQLRAIISGGSRHPGRGRDHRACREGRRGARQGRRRPARQRRTPRVGDGRDSAHRFIKP